MKKIILIIMGIVLFSCKEKQNNVVSVTNEIKTDIIQTKTDENITKKICTEDFYDIFDTDLIGVFASDEIEDNRPYEKYGVSLASVCYSNELIKIKINKNSIFISNYQHPESNKTIEIIDCTIRNDSLIIKLASDEISEMIISKLKDIPVYSSFHKGKDFVELGEVWLGVRISNFFIKEKDLEKFGGIPDCGDFDG